MKLRIATVFSGIGAYEQSLNRDQIDYEIVFACDNGEREIKESREEILQYCKDNHLDDYEINEYVKSLYAKTKKPNYMKKAYFANYNIDENKWHEDIRFIDGNKYKNKVDIFVGGSPCQSFSAIGKRVGLEDARGTLFYDYARLVKEIQPKVFIYENVPGMLNHNKGNTWNVIKDIFESLHYKISYKVLNAKDYGIPQDRKRLFVVGFKDNNISFSFPQSEPLKLSMFDFLEESVDTKHYLGKKGFEFTTSVKYKNRARVNREIIQTQKANQQFNWNGDFVFEPLNFNKHNDTILSRAYVGTYNGVKGVIRQLTHRECMRLMGFSDSFKIVTPNMWAYRQAGNSIVVNVLQAINKEINKSLSKKIRIATVFSGIGSVEFALRRLKINHEIIFACDNGEREINYDIEQEKENVLSLKTIDDKRKYVDQLYNNHTNKKNYVEKSYLANYPALKKNRYFQDVILLDGRDFKASVDLFVGGSPCQSFSSIGFQGGLEDARGTLFYEYARLVKEIQPKVFIYENVRNLLNHDKGKTWNVIKNIFDNLGYKYKYAVLNASDYGIPQTRRRLFVVGFRKDLNIDVEKDFEFPPKKKTINFVMKDFSINNCHEGGMSFDDSGEITLDGIKGKVDDKYTLSPLLYKYVMKTGTKTWSQKVKINLDIARTILKTMGNRHRAGVDNYLSFDGTGNLGSVRMLTEREAHRLMGFTDDYKLVVSRAQAYKQAGNSIVVDVMMAIIQSIIKCNVF